MDLDDDWGNEDLFEDEYEDTKQTQKKEEVQVQ